MDRREAERAQDAAWAGAMARERPGVEIGPPASAAPSAGGATVLPLPPRETRLPPLGERQVHIGEANVGGPVGIDLARLIDGRLLIQGNSGAGKSMLLRRIFEEAFGRVQLVLIDPDGEFATLTESRDVAVFDAAAIGRVGGAALAASLRHHRFSAVLDLSEATAEDRLGMAADVMEGLVAAPPEDWHPMLVLVDEVQVFAPHYDAGDVAADTRKRSTAAFADLMGRGRKRGLAGVFATGRLAETAKAVAAKATNVIVGRTIFDRDLERAGALLGFTAGHAKALRTLADGEFLAIGPAIAGPRRIRFKAAAARSRHKGEAPALAPPPSITASASADLLRELPAATTPTVDAPRRRGRGWDQREDEIVAAGYRDGMTALAIAEALAANGFRRRSPSGISQRAHHMGLISARAAVSWTEEEDAIVAREYDGAGRIMDIVAALGAAGFTRSRQSIQMRAIHLGLTRDRVNYWSDQERQIALKGLADGKTNREIIADLKEAGFDRGVTAISKFAQKNNINRNADPWTPEENDQLLRLYGEERRPAKEIAAILGKTEGAVRSQASKRGLKQRPPWSDAERQVLVDAHTAGERLVDAALKIGRPYPNVARMAATLQLDFRRPSHPPATTTQGEDSDSATAKPKHGESRGTAKKGDEISPAERAARQFATDGSA